MIIVGKQYPSAALAFSGQSSRGEGVKRGLRPDGDLPDLRARAEELNEMWEEKMGMMHHMGQHKWAEMVIWEMLDDDMKKKILLRKLDMRIKRKEFKIGMLKDKVETLKMLRQAVEKK